jgi:hypothetical protein
MMMKMGKYIQAILFLLLMQTAFAQNSNLLGTWQSSNGTELIFSQTRMTIAGAKYNYRVQGSNLYVDDEYGNTYKYPYQISGNKMQMYIPGQGTYVFTKKQAGSKAPFQKTVTGGRQGSSNELYGRWQANNGSVTSFDKQYMTIAGNRYRYTVQGNIITVYDQAGNTMTYKYQLNGKKLYLYVEGAGTYVLTKAGGRNQNLAHGGSAVPAQGNTAANARLYGTFCNYTSSGYSGSSSYSTTRRVSFDGRGHYSYGSQSSYLGDGEGYAGGDGGYSGTYKVQGNKVILTENDGTQYVATIYFVQRSGEITELKYGEKVFAKSLCD